MSFRKRNAPLPHRGPPVSPGASSLANPAPSQPITSSIASPPAVSPAPAVPTPGVRPSPIDGRPVTSTGTPSLDSLLGGHGGLALGNSLLLEEEGTTDYAGTLMRYYAAEGVVQGHQVHVVGMDERWGRELPGVVEESGTGREKVIGRGAGGEGSGKGNEEASEEKMKIAWRYERLGAFGEKGPGVRAGPTPSPSPTSTSTSTTNTTPSHPFTHTFDLTKRLTLPSATSITYIPLSPTHISTSNSTSPLDPILNHLSTALSSFPPTTIHRLLIPSLLSPLLYPPLTTNPTIILPFLHFLRSLLRQYPTRLIAILSLPLSLFPRSQGLVRWIEILSDGVIELVAFPHTLDPGPGGGSSTSTGNSASIGGGANATQAGKVSGGGKKEEEQPQGLVRVHKVPIVSERGGSVGTPEDLAFVVSRKKFVIRLYSLPPVEGEGEEGQGGGVGRGMEF